MNTCSKATNTSGPKDRIYEQAGIQPGKIRFTGKHGAYNVLISTGFRKNEEVRGKPLLFTLNLCP